LTGKTGVGRESVTAGKVQGPGFRTAGHEGGHWGIFYAGTHQSQTHGV